MTVLSLSRRITGTLLVTRGWWGNSAPFTVTNDLNFPGNQNLFTYVQDQENGPRLAQLLFQIVQVSSYTLNLGTVEHFCGLGLWASENFPAKWGGKHPKNKKGKTGGRTNIPKIDRIQTHFNVFAEGGSIWRRSLLSDHKVPSSIPALQRF